LENITGLLEKSQALLKSGSPGDALQPLETALSIEPHSAWAWAHRADILYLHLGQYSEAIESFSRAIELDSNYAWAIAHRGAAYERLDRFAEAEDDLLRSLALKPGYTWSLAMLARVYQMTGRFEQALSAVEEVVARDPTVLLSWRGERAIMRMLLHRHEEAAHYFSEAVQAEPNDRFSSYNSVINLALWRGLEIAEESISSLVDRLNRTVAESSEPREVDWSLYELGGLAALMRREDVALDYLQRASEREAGLVLLSPARKRAKVDMAWDCLRADSRFITLLSHQGITKKGVYDGREFERV